MVILTPLPEESSSFSPNFDHKYTHDVFLNFRGSDTRLNFIDHLHKALRDANIKTFFDDEGIQTGKDLKPELKNAIKASKASIIVLSKNYASSTWCLDELTLILELQRASNHVVIPVFYHVEPTHVRKQKGSFGDALAEHKKKIEAETDPKRIRKLAQKMELWKEALTEVANLKGISANGWPEAELIEEIVRDIRSKLDLYSQREIPFLIGMHLSIRWITSWLRNGSAHTADILTIYGMAGIGKTLLAKYIYEMHHRAFERSCFVADIERSTLLDLQKHLLECIEKGNLKKIQDLDVCTINIEKALLSTQTLIVLDGVNEFKQLDRLLGTKGFYPGSKIIITTQDVSVTEKCSLFHPDISPNHVKHLLKGLAHNDSLELLSWHAFRRSGPPEGYEKVSRKVVVHCEGHPMALEVLGSSLRNRSVVAWKETIELLQEVSNPIIQKVLQISFHSLPSENERELFKHIACFFVRKDRDFTETILKECGIKTNLGFSTLIERCLVTIGQSNELMMHKLLQDMGRDFVIQESPKKPWKRSRLWQHEESYDVLKNEKGTEKIQGLVLEMNNAENDTSHEKLGVLIMVNWVRSFILWIWCLFAWIFRSPSSHGNKRELNANALIKMEKLRLLQLNYVQLQGSYKHFPKGLRWLSMHGFMSSHIPSDIQMDRMVALDMSYSNLQQLWKKPTLLPYLKILNLSFSKLVKIGGFPWLPKLKRLILAGCVNLIEVSESIGKCKKLVFLDFSDCNKLKRLPRSIRKLKSVRYLSIRGCANLIEFPAEIKDMEMLEVLNASYININSQASTCAIVKVVPRHVKSSLILFPCSLVSLSLRNNNLTNESFPMDFSSMSQLKALDLSWNQITFLPAFVGSLKRLAILCLKDCCSLTSISRLPSTIEILDANNCPLLEKITIHPDILRQPGIGFQFAEALTEIEGMRKIQALAEVDEEILHRLDWNNIEHVKNQQLKVLDMIAWDKAKTLPVQLFYELGVFTTSFRSVKIPIWLSHISNGNSITFIVPSSRNNIRGLNVGYLYKYSNSGSHIDLENVTKRAIWRYEHFFQTFSDDKSMVCLTHWVTEEDMIDEGDEITITVRAGVHPLVCADITQCGISLVYGDGNEDRDALAAYHPLKYPTPLLAMILPSNIDHIYVKKTWQLFSPPVDQFCERATTNSYTYAPPPYDPQSVSLDYDYDYVPLENRSR